MDDRNTTIPEQEQEKVEQVNSSQTEEVKTADKKTKINLKDHFQKLKKRIDTVNFSQNYRRFQIINQRKFKKYYLYIIAGVVALLIIVALLVAVVFPNTQKVSQASNQPQLASALATETVNKTYVFSFKDSNNKVIGNIKYTIDKLELRNQIYLQGQSASALKGKTFLIAYLKLKNDYKQGIKMNTRDYVRLSINNNQTDWLAPNIHNDPVEVQALSTENTRLGFVINTTDKNLILRVGEIDGVKQTINLNIK